MVAVSCLSTMALGVWLRWYLAGSLSIHLPFANLLHAHSHLGYFGILFPLAWIGWKGAGARAPGRIALVGYALGTTLACIGFVRSGYGPIAIAGSTAVAAFWLWSASALLKRMGRLHDALGGVPIGIVASLACVPPIAIYLRSEPLVAHGFVSTFLSGLLLVVIVPSTFGGRGLSPGPWPLFLLVGCLGALFLGVAPHPVTRICLFIYAALVLTPCRSNQLELHARILWAFVACGLGAMAIGVLPNIRPVALGAIHFLILGPVMATLAPLWLRRVPPTWAWWLGHASIGTMAGALVMQAFIADFWTWRLAAAGGTATLLWWCCVLALQWFPAHDLDAPRRMER